MIHQKNLSVLAIIFLATLTITTSFTPAFAAQKVENTKFDYSQSFQTFGCEQEIQQLVNVKGHTIIWDNGRYNLHGVAVFVFTDISGNRVAQATYVITQHGTFDDGPKSGEVNFVATCIGSGHFINIHLGITVHKDVTITLRE